MSLITDTWRQLVRRRLWPIAVLLLGGLVAVPMLLAKSPAAPPPAAAAPPAADAAKPVGGGLEAKPVVDVADATSRGRRHVLGARKDPFAPGPQPKVKATPSPGAVSTVTPSSTTLPGSGSSGGGSPLTTSTSIGGGGGGGLPTVTSPVTPTTPTTPSTPSKPRHKVAPGTLTVRFGDATSSPVPKLAVKRLDALPDADNPVAIYLGHGHGKRTAVFLIDSSVTPEGDASCLPSGSDCQKIELRVGETEFLTVAGDTATAGTDSTSASQYELDLVRIAGVGEKKARAAHARGARTARVGRTVARVVRLLHP